MAIAMHMVESRLMMVVNFQVFIVKTIFALPSYIYSKSGMRSMVPFKANPSHERSHLNELHCNLMRRASNQS